MTAPEMMVLFTKVGSQFQQKTHYPVSVQQSDRASVISLSLVMKMLNITTSTFSLHRKYLFCRLFHDPQASIMFAQSIYQIFDKLQ